ncbi:hypothetical protein CYMTET_46763 [Cymbomonas tetramitiformis]|uniref:Uncharacterized protein n=1 Tax=Cymbomonas tetramitiformis TaxID=36881 RepID=A0AAE0EWZ8_9CHLO|nr:hypothetical protein CYMTET_46763 [Cymbomonas tetramitiformis]
MLSAKKTKKELKDEAKARETLEALRRGGHQGPPNKQDAKAEEWATWLTQETKKYKGEARQCVQEHESQAKVKRTNKMVKEYWSNQKQYHKKIYRAAQENGRTPSSGIQAMKEREEKLATGEQRIADTLMEHLEASAPYNMQQRDDREVGGFPWSDDSREDHVVTGPRPTITTDHLGVHKEAYLRAVYGMNNNKAPGPTRVSNEILKHMPEEFHDQLHRLMQEMWRNKHVPTNWKEGTFCLHHKKNDPTEQRTTGR